MKNRISPQKHESIMFADLGTRGGRYGNRITPQFSLTYFTISFYSQFSYWLHCRIFQKQLKVAYIS